MNGTLAFLAALLFAVPAAGGEAPQATLVPTVEETARRVQAAYDQTRDLTARFTQEATSVALGRTQKAAGTVWLKKPGKMRWDYEGKDGKPGQVLVSDGKTLWIYNPEDRTVIRDDVGGALERTPLAFLMGLGELTRDFEVARPSGTVEIGGPGDLVLQLTPKQSIAALQELYLAVDPKRALVTAALIVDPFGNRTRIAFEGIRTNAGTPDSRFAFTVPPGVQVVAPPRLNQGK